MHKTFFLTAFLLIKYTLKRRWNQLGFVFHKKKTSKSRQANKRKTTSFFGKALQAISLLYFLSVLVVLIWNYNHKILKASFVEHCNQNQTLPISEGNSETFKENVHKKHLEQKEHPLSYDQLIEFFDDNYYLIYNINVFKNRHNHNSENVYETRYFEKNDSQHKLYVSLMQEMIITDQVKISEYNSSQAKLDLRKNSSYLVMIYCVVFLLLIFSLSNAIVNNLRSTGAISQYLEWLACNGVKPNQLFLFRILENSFGSVMNWFFLLPVLFTIFYFFESDHYVLHTLLVWPIYSLLIGIFLTTLEILAQYVFPSRFSKSIWAFFNISMIGCTLTFYLLTIDADFLEKAYKTTKNLKPIMNWVPFYYLPFINSQPISSHLNDVLFFLLPFLFIWFIHILSSRLTKNGLIRQTFNLTSKRNLEKNFTFHPVSYFKNAIINFETLMLLRQKQLLLLIIFMPLIVLGYNFYLLKGQNSVFLNHQHFAAITFGVCAYVYMYTTFPVVTREYKALPLLLTLPIDPSNYFTKKVNLWVWFSFFFFGLANTTYFIIGGSITILYLINMLFVLIGLYIFGFISICMGIVSFNPNEEITAKRTSGGYFFLYLYLSTLFVRSFYIDDLYNKLNIVMIVAFLTFAFKVKVHSVLRYYLDSTQKLKDFSIFDATLLCVVYFSVLTIAQMFLAFSDNLKEKMLFFSSLIATISTILTLFIFYRKHSLVKNALQELFQPSKLSVFSKYSLAVYPCVILFSLLYVLFVYHFNLLNSKEAFRNLPSYDYILLAIFTAPFIEEVLFRRFLFTTLQHHFSVRTSIFLSALLFAIIHPLVSFIPVAILGVATAWLYHKTKEIYQCIFLHMLYNLCVVLQHLFLNSFQ